MSKPVGAMDVKLKGWSGAQVERAVQSLLNFIGKQQAKSTMLLGDEDEMLYLQLSLKKMPLQSRKDKPVPLPLPHPFLSPEGAEICLFVKDHKGEGHKEAKKRLQQYERMGGVAKVVGLSKLRTKYESHEAKRELCKLYDLFLADERILPMLPKLIGKSFFQKKKQPIPIDLTVKDFPAQVKKACAATYLYKGSGTCINLRIARSNLGADAIAANIHAALVQAVEHIPKKWGNVQGVFIKTVESVALPLFQTLPDAPQRISITASVPAQEQQGKAALTSAKGEDKPSKVKPAQIAGTTAAGAAKAAPAKAAAPAAAVAAAKPAPAKAAAAAKAVKKAAAVAPAAAAAAGKAEVTAKAVVTVKVAAGKPAAAAKAAAGKAAAGKAAAKAKAAPAAKAAAGKAAPAGEAAETKKRAAPQAGKPVAKRQSR